MNDNGNLTMEQGTDRASSGDGIAQLFLGFRREPCFASIQIGDFSTVPEFIHLLGGWGFERAHDAEAEPLGVEVP